MIIKKNKKQQLKTNYKEQQNRHNIKKKNKGGYPVWDYMDNLRDEYDMYFL